MRRHHVLSRRLFLSELGRRTVAVGVLGAGLAACASSDDQVTPAADEGAGGLRWERVDFGFVAAFVLARGDEVAVVDSGTAGNSANIETALSTLGFGWSDVDHVIVTHAHGDHVGGLEEVLTSAPESTGYAGAGDIANIRTTRGLVAVTGGEEVFGLEILATPGHTPGHICAFDPGSGLLLAGDAVVADADGQLAGPAEQFSSDIARARESVRDLAEAVMPETILVGHGAAVTQGANAQLDELAATF